MKILRLRFPLFFSSLAASSQTRFISFTFELDALQSKGKQYNDSLSRLLAVVVDVVVVVDAGVVVDVVVVLRGVDGGKKKIPRSLFVFGRKAKADKQI